MGRNAQRRREESPKAERMAAAALRKLEAENQRVNDYQSGYLDGYLQAVEDVRADPVVNRVAARIIAVHRDPQDQARYVTGIVQNVLRPSSASALLEGLRRATEAWIAKREAPAQEPVEAA